MISLPVFRIFCVFLCLGMLPADPVFADVIVHTVSQLVTAVNSTGSGGDRIILIADGAYNLNGQYLRIAVSGVTVRSQSGKRAQVILDGNYQTTEIFQIVASNVTIADLTLKRALDHPIHVMGGSSGNVVNTLIKNVHIIDPGEQAIKINPSGAFAAHSGTIQNSLIELTSSGRTFVENDTSNGYPCYTGGIDAHGAEGWTVQDNEIRGFWCSTGLSEHGIHFWSNSSNTLVERNLIVDCDRGIGFGLGSSGHSGGTIRNNMISHGVDHGFSDVGISLESATGARVYNNTIFQEHDYQNALEYRFAASTNLTIVNNLANRAIAARDGGTTALLANNITGAAAAWFVNVAAGDLHLRSERSGVTGAALAVTGLDDDFDKQSRPLGAGIDIGADEYSLTVPDKKPPGASSRRTLSWLLLLTGTP